MVDAIAITRLRGRQPERLVEVAKLISAQLSEHRISSESRNVFAGLEKIVAEPARGFIFVAKSNGCIVGVAYASALVSLEHGGVSGWLEELYVLADWLGRGIGVRLLEQTILYARRLGWKAIDLEVDEQHRRVESLYFRQGFRPVLRKRLCLALDEESKRAIFFKRPT
jgi:GNAT superfamily N-acetyltransferase